MNQEITVQIKFFGAYLKIAQKLYIHEIQKKEIKIY